MCPLYSLLFLLAFLFLLMFFFPLTFLLRSYSEQRNIKDLICEEGYQARLGF